MGWITKLVVLTLFTAARIEGRLQNSRKAAIHDPMIIPVQPTAYPAQTSIVGAAEPTVEQQAQCVSWSQEHYLTFDGQMYNFKGQCTYKLVGDCADNTFNIHVRHQRGCNNTQPCHVEVILYIGNFVVTLRHTPDGPAAFDGDRQVSIPANLHGLLVERIASYVVVRSGLGFKIKWDGADAVYVEVTEDLFGKTCGLCGKYDRDVHNDFTDISGKVRDHVLPFAASWKMPESEGDICSDSRQNSHCNTQTMDGQIAHTQAAQICTGLKTLPEFQPCHEYVDQFAYYESCKEDVCLSGGLESAACNSFEAYFRECLRHGVHVNWRSDTFCPANCAEGMEYLTCGTSCPETCRTTLYDCEDNQCIDGCHCPEGTYLNGGECLPHASCPCLSHGVEHPPGSHINSDCNDCECVDGKWECTTEPCEATCIATGDPHYITFDGRSYDFMGDCSYTMVMNKMTDETDYSIEAENQECDSGSTRQLTCTRSVTVKTGSTVLKLKQGKSVLLNGEDIVRLPHRGPGVYIETATSIFQKVTLDNGLRVLWDGVSRLYITAPPKFVGRTMGLCGTFNYNQQDDFYTKVGDIETNPIAFANKWKTDDLCADRPLVPTGQETMHPCDIYQQLKTSAQQHCGQLMGSFFTACHQYVNPQESYDRCMFDYCGSGHAIQSMCDAMSDYSLACGAKGVELDWRQNTEGCEVSCSGELVYDQCHPGCQTTCASILEGVECEPFCVEGCACPEGTVLDYEGHCVPPEECGCMENGKHYLDGASINRGCNTCMCSKGQWACTEMACLPDSPALCPDNQIWSNCVVENQITCKNMHLGVTSQAPVTCHAGCQCRNDTVWDEEKGACVMPQNCPCYHGGQSYEQSHTIQLDCNTCFCNGQQWVCEVNECAGICTTFGDPHYKTFDGKMYEFQGDCDYVLAKSKDGASLPFSVTAENIPCGTSGVTCTKNIIVTLGSGASRQRLSLVRGQPITADGTDFTIRQAGMFVFVSTPIGLTLQWDKGTRVYIKLVPAWKGYVEGLCGNFNGNQMDDFTTPMGGPPVTMANTFGDSWKVHDYCMDAVVVEDTCALHPNRQAWALRKCAILKSDVFRPCHSEVPYQPYYDKCVYDACGCDSGGDCECLCTAIAAYAQECNLAGVPIKWREQEICPMQCEYGMQYVACSSSCPKTCDNMENYSEIAANCTDTCVEGCACPPGFVVGLNGVSCVLDTECFQEETTPLPPTTTASITTGTATVPTTTTMRPTTTTTPKPTTTTPAPVALDAECVQPYDYWTEWMNVGYPSPMTGGDYETIENLRYKYVFCQDDDIVSVECKVNGHSNLYAEHTGQVVTCDTTVGLVCNNMDQPDFPPACYDYAIRFFCSCGELPTTTQQVTTTVKPTTTAFTTTTATSEEPTTTTKATTTMLTTTATTTEKPPPPSTTTFTTSTASTTTKPFSLPMECPVAGADAWTPWMNVDTPADGDGGDYDTLEALHQKYVFCEDNMITQVECQVVGFAVPADMTGQKVTCDVTTGLICINDLQLDQKCYDYEIRVFCACGEETTTGISTTTGVSKPTTTAAGTTTAEVTKPTSTVTTPKPTSTEHGTATGETTTTGTATTTGTKTPPTTTTETSETKPVQFEVSTKPQLCPVPNGNGWTSFMSSGTPTDTSDGGEFETIDNLREHFSFCPNDMITDVQCSLVFGSGMFTAPSIGQTVTCNTTHGLICLNEDNPILGCMDYQVQFYCECGPESTTLSGTATSTIEQTTTGISTTTGVSNPTTTAAGTTTAEVTKPTSTVTTPKPTSTEHGTTTGETTTTGTATTTGTKTPPTTTAEVTKPTSTVTTPKPTSTEHGTTTGETTTTGTATTTGTKTPPTTTAEGTTHKVCVEGWTTWISSHKPNPNDIHDGDFEYLNALVHDDNFNLCGGDMSMVADIQCQEINTQTPWSSTGQMGLTCDTHTGFSCSNSMNYPEGCLDYEISVLCKCVPTTTHSTTSTVTSTTTTLKPTTQTATTKPHQPPMTTAAHQTTSPGTTIPTTPQTLPPLCEYPDRDFWTQWMSVGHPGNGQGDIDTIEILRTKYSFCENNMITAIDCRVISLHESPEDAGQKVVCDAQIGLICVNSDQQACYDYEVRFFCECGPEATTQQTTSTIFPTTTGSQTATTTGIATTTGRTTTTGETTTTTTGATTAAPQVCVEGWTTWISSHKPNPADSSDGDFEYLNALVNDDHFNLCGGDMSMVADIQCQEINTQTPWSSTGQNGLICNTQTGFSCSNSMNQPEGCLDYEISVFCHCGEITTQHTTSTVETTTTGVTTTSGVSPTTGTSTTTGSSPVTTKPPVTTGKPIGTTPIPENPPGLPTEQATTSETASTTAATTSTAETTTTGKTTTTAPQVCVEGWTTWISSHKPNPADSSDGDFEYLNALVHDDHFNLCGGDMSMVAGIQCQQINTQTPWDSTGQHGLTCNPQTGFSCSNSMNQPEGCLDYEISVFCHCGETTSQQTTSTISPTTTGSQTATTTGIATTTGRTTTTGETTTTTTGVTTTAPQVCVEGWTTWISSHKPNPADSSDGDFEDLNALVHDDHFNLCGGDMSMVADINCQEINTQTPWSSTGQNGLTCNPQTGFSCSNSMNQPEGCLDYEISVLCHCGETTSQQTTSTISPTTTGSQTATTTGIATTTGRTTTTGETTTTTTGVTTTAPQVCVEGWTTWISSHKPNPADSSDGDFEDLNALVHDDHFNLCGGDMSMVADIQCQEINTQTPWDSTGQHGLTCNPQTGFSCSNSMNQPEGCLDYEISVFCHCGETTSQQTTSTISPTTTGSHISTTTGIATTTGRTTTTGETTTTTTGVTTTAPQVCVEGWTTWISSHKPNPADSSDGDFEYLNALVHDDHFNLCGGDMSMVADINCQEINTQTPWFSTGQDGLICSTQTGFSCSNSMNQPEGCLDYEISVLCHCGETTSQQTTSTISPTTTGSQTATTTGIATTTGRTTTTGETTTTTTGATTSAPQVCVEDWTTWISSHKPNPADSSDGDFEYLNALVHDDHFNLCGGDMSMVADINCQEINTQTPWFSTGQDGLSCDTQTGFFCSNSMNQPEGCLDYEISVFCHCGETTTQQTTSTVETTTTGVTTTSGVSPTTGTSTTTGSSPGTTKPPVTTGKPIGTTPIPENPPGLPTEQATTSGTASTTAATTSTAETTTTGKQTPTATTSGETPTSTTGKTTTVQTTTTGVQTTTAKQTPTSTATSTTTVAQTTECKNQWTSWMNSGKPASNGLNGDYETITNLQQMYDFCSPDMIVDVECRVAEFNTPLDEVNQIVTCDIKDGLVCVNDYQTGALGCSDYEIRFFCRCGGPTTTMLTTSQTSRPTPTTMVTTTTSVSTPTVTPTIHTQPPAHSTTPAQQILVGCEHQYPYWTQWMSVNTPSPNTEGDSETIQELRPYYRFCDEGMIVDVQCRVTESGIPADLTEQTVTCDAAVGLTCLNADQSGPFHLCDDYEVRFFCVCGETTMAPTTTTHVTTTSTVETTTTGVTTTTGISTTTGKTPITTTGSTTGTTVTPTTAAETATKPSDVGVSMGCLHDYDYWTEWMNTDSPDRHDGDDVEFINNLREEYTFCGPFRVEAVECRVYGTQLSVEQGGQQVTCDEHSGLICHAEDQHGGIGECYDYEIRFLCDCGVETTPPAIPSTTSTAKTTTTATTTSTGITTTTGETTTTGKETPTTTTEKPTTGTTSTFETTTTVATTSTGVTTSTGETTTTGKTTTTSTAETFTTGKPISTTGTTTSTAETTTTGASSTTGSTTPGKPTTMTASTLSPNAPEGTSPPPTTYPAQFGGTQGGETVSFEPTEPGWGFIPETTEKPPIPIPHLPTPVPTHVLMTTLKGCEADVDYWTPWMNVFYPTQSNGGDYETLDNLRDKYMFCDDGMIVSVECRTADVNHIPSDQSGQKVICDIDNGLICSNDMNAPEYCHDYEIRFFCDCGVEPTTLVSAETTTTTQAATTGVATTTGVSKPTTTVSSTTTGKETTPGTYSTTSTLGSSTTGVVTTTATNPVSTSTLLTSTAVQTSTVSTTGKPTPPTTTGVSPTTTSTISPTTGHETTTGKTTPTPASTTTTGTETSTISTTPKPTPGTTTGITTSTVSEGSTSTALHTTTGKTSPGPVPTTTTGTLTSTVSTTPKPTPGTTTGVSTSTATEGSTSTALHTTTGKTTPAPVPTTTTGTLTSTASTTPKPVPTTTSGVLPTTTSSITTSSGAIITTTTFATKPTSIFTTNVATKPVPQENPPMCLTNTNYWTEWMNNGSPSTGEGGDFESIDSLREQYVFCDQGMMAAVQCRVVGTNNLMHDQSDQNVTCSIHQGLECHNMDQAADNYMCHDYEIRFFCECGPATTTTMVTTTKPTTALLTTTTPKPVTETTGTPAIHGETVSTTMPLFPVTTGGKPIPSTTGQISTEKPPQPTTTAAKPTTTPPLTSFKPTTVPVTTSTMSTMRPFIVMDTCIMFDDTIQTFDGTVYDYPICNNVLAKDCVHNRFEVHAFLDCTGADNRDDCNRGIYVRIGEDVIILDRPNTQLTLNGQAFNLTQLPTLNANLENRGIRISSVGNEIIIETNFGINIYWSKTYEARIVVHESLQNMLCGMCGTYNHQSQDDFTLQDASLTDDAIAFGDSWMVGECPFTSTVEHFCPPEIEAQAEAKCDVLRTSVFSACHPHVPVDLYYHLCVNRVCECHTNGTDLADCECDPLSAYATTCERLDEDIVLDWRNPLRCPAECPPGMVYHECGPGCPTSCDNMHDSNVDCNVDCVSGCFCPDNMVQQGDQCIRPALCTDCYCYGYGDPHYITFDGTYYPFQGQCSYVLARETTTHEFEVIGDNELCEGGPNPTCTKSVTVRYGGHEVTLNRNRIVSPHSSGSEVTVDGVDQSAPVSIGGINVFVNGLKLVLEIPAINLRVRYDEVNHGFDILVPSSVYYDRTEGLCGPCNHDGSDDLTTSQGTIETNSDVFALSWMTLESMQQTEMQCGLIESTSPPQTECVADFSQCEVILSDVFEECHQLVNPQVFLDTCKYDVCNVGLELSCDSLAAYARECDRHGVCLEWREGLCEFHCPAPMEFHSCGAPCPMTCDMVTGLTPVTPCQTTETEGCFCPPHMVLDHEGNCVPPESCPMCVDETGRPFALGDTWHPNNDPCETCTCKGLNSTSCVQKVCPQFDQTHMVCRSGHNVPVVWDEDHCCAMPQFDECTLTVDCSDMAACQLGEIMEVSQNGTCYCRCVPEECPSPVMPTLSEGQMAVPVDANQCCAEYTAVCNSSMCSDKIPGQYEVLVEMEGQCCPQLTCDSSLCPIAPTCSPYHTLQVTEGHCCEEYQCVCDDTLCPVPPSCQDDEVLLSTVGECCTTFECSCDKTQCDETIPSCPVSGMTAIVSNAGGCCSQYECTCQEPMGAHCSDLTCPHGFMADMVNVNECGCPTACVSVCGSESCYVNGSCHSSGDMWTPDDVCTVCSCKPNNGAYEAMCETQVCTACPAGYTMVDMPGQCCGECTKTDCVVMDAQSDQEFILYQPGDEWVQNGEDQCNKEECKCVEQNGMVSEVCYTQSCPAVTNCPEEFIMWDEQGCCQICQEPPSGSCSAELVEGGAQVLAVGTCATMVPVNVTQCAGHCPSFTTVSFPNDLSFESAYNHECQCCQPSKSERRTVDMMCEDGTLQQHSYDYILECTCDVSKCLQWGTEPETP
ncbi:uncharacterized protein LOC144903401 isoform X4 [Branchiostoma floridae x Branchiostoma belcheri]